MRCRGCGLRFWRAAYSVLGDEGNEYPAFVCFDCGTVSVERPAGTYETLHASEASSYSFHSSDDEQLARLMGERKVTQISELLATSNKRRWAIDLIAGLRPSSKIIEIGCSTGSLCSLCVALGHKYIGVDVSATAVNTASERFGPNFYQSEEDWLEEAMGADLILILGTIGCADEPVAMIEQCLGIIAPNGQIAFNCPNGATPTPANSAWPYSTSPPDHVTIFTPEFWSRFATHTTSVDILRLRSPQYKKWQIRRSIIRRGLLRRNAGMLQRLSLHMQRTTVLVLGYAFKLMHLFSPSYIDDEYGIHVIIRNGSLPDHDID